MEEKERTIWQFPWRYTESLVFVTGIICVGFALQVIVGEFDFSLLVWPVNGILGGITLLLSILLGRKRNNSIVRWLSGVPMAVALICGLLFLGILMGLTPQMMDTPTDRSLVSILGFNRMTTSWPFVLTYFFTLLSLGTLIVRRLSTFRKSDYAFYLNHIGLWLVLFASGWGAADIKRYVMHVQEGETEWRVYNERGMVLDLPIAIQLNDFRMEEYPPQLAVIDRQTGGVQPLNNPAYLQLEEKPMAGKLGLWDIEVEEYIHEAVRNSDSTYHAVSMPGSSPAARIKATHSRSKQTFSGWVCCGNSAQLYMMLPLGSQYCIVMTTPEPRRFVSDINVFTADGKETHTLLEVNKPHRTGNWMIYQYGYDFEAGKLSSYSSLELVYDPWVIPVYIGILLLAVGSVCMLWSGNKKKEEKK